MKKRFLQLAACLIAALWLAACAGSQPYTCQPTQFGREYPYGSPAFSFTSVWFHNADQSLWAGLDAQPQESNARFPYKNQTVWKIMWWRSDQATFGGSMHVDARRLDGETSPISADGQAVTQEKMLTALTIPSAGCWEITGKTGDKTVTFVMELTE